MLSLCNRNRHLGVELVACHMLRLVGRGTHARIAAEGGSNRSRCDRKRSWGVTRRMVGIHHAKGGGAAGEGQRGKIRMDGAVSKEGECAEHRSLAQGADAEASLDADGGSDVAHHEE